MPGRSLPKYNPTRYRDRLSTEYLKELNARQHGRKAIEKVGRTQPAALPKIIALTLPKEHKVEHSRSVSELSDQQLNAMIEALSARLEARAAGIDVPPLIDVTTRGRSHSAAGARTGGKAGIYELQREGASAPQSDCGLCLGAGSAAAADMA
jgi:hypothetical protein